MLCSIAYALVVQRSNKANEEALPSTTDLNLLLAFVICVIKGEGDVMARCW